METRVKRYSKRNRIKRRIKKLGIKGILINLLKFYIKNVFYLIVGLLYATYLVIKNFDNMISKLFMKLPRLMKVALIYALVFNTCQTIYNTFNIQHNYKEVSVTKTSSNPQILAVAEEKEDNTNICTLDHETACKIKNKAIEYGIDWKMAVAISKWETGNFTSSLYLNFNNVGGMYCNGFIKYNSLEEGIEAFVKNLKTNYFDVGLNTIELIGSKYCPVGAKNDPNGLNKNWIPGVTQMYNELEK